MITQLLLSAVLSPGQPPATLPMAQPPMVLPGTTTAAPNLPTTMPPGPGAAAVPPPAAYAPLSAAPCATCPTGAAAAEKKDEAKKPDPYFLMGALRDTWLGTKLEEKNITITGWTEGNFTASTAKRSNFPLALNDRANFFQMNQNYLHIEKALDTSKKEFQWGFVNDFILPGTDSRFTIARGLWDSQLTNGPDGGPRRYPIDAFQSYGQAYLPDLGGEGTTVKIGRFATFLEYETVQAVDTPFVSRSYLFQYNPFTHTGVLATTQFDDTWSMSNGLAVGNDNFIDPANRLTYLGQVKWAPKEGKTTVAFGTSVTNPQYNVGRAFNFYNVYNLQVTHKFTDKFSYVLDASFSHEDNIPDVGSANWYGAVNYFIYKVNDKLTSTLRAEVFEDTKGVRTGFRGLYTEVTYGVAYSPIQDVILRPSVRYDHNALGRPFEGKSDLFTATMDVILRW